MLNSVSTLGFLKAMAALQLNCLLLKYSTTAPTLVLSFLKDVLSRSMALKIKQYDTAANVLSWILVNLGHLLGNETKPSQLQPNEEVFISRVK